MFYFQKICTYNSSWLWSPLQPLHSEYWAAGFQASNWRTGGEYKPRNADLTSCSTQAMTN